MTAPETWLPINDAARVAGISAKALRRRIERGTVTSEMHADRRRRVLVQSIAGADPAPAPADPATPAPQQVAELLKAIEAELAGAGPLLAWRFTRAQRRVSESIGATAG